MGVIPSTASSSTSTRVLTVSKTVAFSGAAGNGAVGSVSLFTVTGEALIVRLVPFCTEDLVGAAGISLGVTGSTTLFIAATTATDIDNGEFWFDTAPDPNGTVLPAALKDIVVTDDIILTITSANITDGTIRFDIAYLALSSDCVVAAA